MGKRGPVPKRKAERRRRNKGPSEKDRLYKEAQRLEIPGRSKMTKAELERAVKRAGAGKPAVAVATSRPAKCPPADSDWHPIAKRWYESLAASGQSDFYQASDWALAELTAESISRDLKPRVVGVNDDGPVFAEVPINGTSLSAYLKSMTALMVSEGDRRRAGIELTEAAAPEEPADPKVAILDDYRQALGRG